MFASIGPTGKMLMMGEVTEDELRAAFSEQAQALAQGGADGLVIETMSDLGEIKIALAAAKSTGLPVVASMTFDSGKNKDRTMMGVTPEQAAAGAGDSRGRRHRRQLRPGHRELRLDLRPAARRNASCPSGSSPTPGLPDVVGGQVVYRTTPEHFAVYAPAMIQAGCSFLGGCCGSNPDFVALHLLPRSRAAISISNTTA